MQGQFVAILVCLGGYLLGSIPFGLVLTRVFGAGDIRKIGSGNIGATNVLRTGRKELAAATLVLDGAKGAVALLIARQYFNQDIALLAGFFAVLGHLFPVWLGFKGGKGVATGLGLLLAASWPVGIAACALWLAGYFATRISSVGALVAFAGAPVAAFVLGDLAIVKLSLTVAVLVYVRHQANIRRLIAGTEPRSGGGKPKAA